MKKIILFDLDGTLIDSTPAILKSFDYAFNKMSFNFKGNTHDIKALIGHPLDKMFLDLGVEEKKVWEFVTVYKENYRKISTLHTCLLEHSIDAIKLASSFATLGIVTTKTGIYSRELMEFFDVMHYFDTLIGRENVINPKPHQEPILKALEELNVTDIDAKNIWIIGDTSLDIIAAKNAGISHVAVTSGYETKEQLLKTTNTIFPDVKQAVSYIEKL